MTVRDAFAAATVRLKKHACARKDASREAEAFLVSALGKPREFLLAHPEAVVNQRSLSALDRAVRRRLAHEPFELVLGHAVFFGKKFAVKKGVLVPRAATEFLVAAVLDAAAKQKNPTFFDVGTGSGCIAATLAAQRPDAAVFATDISRVALALAKKNAAALGVARQIAFSRTPFFGTFLPKLGANRGPIFVVANLPYLPAAARKSLPKEIIRHEPAEALFSGRDGLDAYRILLRTAAEASRTHEKQIILFLEILPRQAAPLRAFVKKLNPRAAMEPILAGTKNAVGLAVAFPGPRRQPTAG